MTTTDKNEMAYSNNMSTIREAVTVDGSSKAARFTVNEAVFIAKILNGDGAAIFVGLMSKANATGVCNGIEEERRRNFMA